MVERARLRMGGRAAVTYRTMNGEHPDACGPLDLICSSLAVQWFEDLAAGIGRLAALLEPHGWLAFSTLVEGSFAEWRDAHGDLACGMTDYPSVATLQGMGCTVEVMDVPIEGGAAMFLNHLLGIGAGVPRPGYRPLTSGQLRQVMRSFDRGGGVTRYCVAICSCLKEHCRYK
jgi:malonyl-CoA O-methyltransferase